MNFSFILPGVLAGMERPGTYESIDADLDMLVRAGIRGVVSLTPHPIDPDELSLRGLEGLHLPVPDFAAPRPDQVDRFVEFVEQWKPVVVHCGVGMGRTGTMLGCYLVRTGLGSEEAIRRVRELRPGSIETAPQETAIRAYADRRAARKDAEGHA